MASELKTLQPDQKGAFSLKDIARGDIKRIDLADIDLVITTNSGATIVLAGAGLAAMSDAPPAVVFSDSASNVSALLSEVGVATSVDLSVQIPSTLQTEAEKKAEEEEKEKEKNKEEDNSPQSSSQTLTQNTEASVEKLVDEAQKVADELHKSDYDYVPPHQYQPPTAPVSAAPGVPPPISLTPIVNITIGNVVGTTVDTTTTPGTTYIYGGGGATATTAADGIGPRDPLQFSAATITGTSGNDIIYANGPLVGNATPSADRSYNAKEILLSVAGYFTTLDDIQITGVPDEVSFTGATNNGGGSWTLPADTVISNSTIKLVYDMVAARALTTDYFDIDVTVSGTSTRNVNFTTTQSFRFQYIDVTDVSQITDPTLVYSSHGISKQIYVLPTLAQPSIINSGEGDDFIYGGYSHDTITAGDGDNTIETGQGNDSITIGDGDNSIDMGADDDTLVTGDGDNTVDLGDGDNEATTGSGNDTITAGTGDDVIVAGDGTNSVAASDGDNEITTGSGNDTITAGDGDNIIAAGAGTNSITLGDGVNDITTGSGNDTITVGTGDVTIRAGAGVNTITTNGGVVDIETGDDNDTLTINGGGGTIVMGAGINALTATSGNYTVSAGVGDDTISLGNGDSVINAGAGVNNITVGDGDNTIETGAGDDTIVAGNGDNTFKAGLGTNSITAGSGNNTADYSAITTTGIAVTLAASGASTLTGTGLSDSLTGIRNIVGTDLADTINGNSSANVLTGGAGNDTITSGGGNDTIYGGAGNDTITGGTGSDVIYAGDGDNIVYTGTSGSDFIYGGSGNNTFYSQHAGVRYNGTNGAELLSGVVNTVNYATSTSAMTIDLSAGVGSGGLAQSDVYAMSPTFGINTINGVVGGTRGDTLIGSDADDVLNGGGANGSLGDTERLTGGLGNNTLIGGTGSGARYYYGGLGNDTFVGGTDHWDQVVYRSSTAALVINISDTVRTFTNSLGNTVTVAAFSGTSKQATTADASAFSIGDTYQVLSGTTTSIDQFDGSNYGDIVWVGTDNMQYFSGSGVDYYYGGSGADRWSYSRGADRVDGGSGSGDIFYMDGEGGRRFNAVLYLDGSADINSNGIADYLDKGLTTLTSGSVTYTGFAFGYNNETTSVSSTTTLLRNFEYLLGSNDGNDLLVGNSGVNLFNGRGGSDVCYGLGGNDIFYLSEGSYTVYGGSGTDTVSFATGFSWGNRNWLNNNSYVFLGDGSFFGASDKAYYLGAGFTAYNSKTGSWYSTISEVENISGGGNNDILYGNSSANIIYGDSGNDIIAGNGGTDSLYGEAGNDTFYITASEFTSLTIAHGSSGTDTLVSAGLTVTASSISDGKLTNMEVIDARNSVGGGTYSLRAMDIQWYNDNGNSSSFTLKIDSGDSFTAVVGAGTGALSYLVAASTATNTTYYFYSDAAHAVANSTNRVAILDVYTGTG